MGWSIRLDWEHIELWRRRLYAWWALMLLGVVITWSRGPRIDEFLFVTLAVPTLFLTTYATGCLLVASTKVLWTVARERVGSLVLGYSRYRIGSRSNCPQTQRR